MENSITQLIEACRHGGRMAQVDIYRMYARRIYQACLRITGNPSDAEEAMQDTFLKAFTHLAQYHGGTSFDAWLRQIAVRTAIDYVRRREPTWEELPDNYPLVSEERDEDEDEELSVAAIKSALAKLAPGYRVVLSLYLFEGYDMEEISLILHLQPASVRSQYLRGKKKLLDIIKKEKHG